MSDDLARFDEVGRALIDLARREAAEMGHDYVSTAHILLAIARTRPDLLRGVTHKELKHQLVKLLGPNQA